MSEETLFVPRDFVMNPEDDDLLFDGTMLRTGMVVLLEDGMMRDMCIGTDSPIGRAAALERSRWCEVGRVNVRPRYDRDENDRVVATSPLVEFEAIYPDGSKTKRTYDASYAWFVKKFSIPE